MTRATSFVLYETTKSARETGADKVSWKFTGDSGMFKVTGGSSEGLPGPARLGVKEGRVGGEGTAAEDGGR